MTNTENERRTEEALKLSSLFEELDGRRPRLFMPELEDDDDKEARKLGRRCKPPPLSGKLRAECCRQ